jgi:hypothetical protein
LSKIKGKPGLVAEKRTIRGKKSTYQATRYISRGDLKKRAKEFLSERERTSYVTRYVGKHFEDIDILLPNELESIAKESKSGEKYYSGYNIKNIKRSIEFKYPEDIRGLVRIVCTTDGLAHLKTTDIKSEKNAKVRFKRSAKVGPQIDNFINYYQKLLLGKGFDKQLGIILGIIQQHALRVGSEDKATEDKIIKIEDIKPRMLVRHSSWKSETPPCSY